MTEVAKPLDTEIKKPVESVVNGDIIQDVDSEETDNQPAVVDTDTVSNPPQDDDLLCELDQELGTRESPEQFSTNVKKLSTLREQVELLESSNQSLKKDLEQLNVEHEKELEKFQQSLADSDQTNQGLQRTVAKQLDEINRWKERVDVNDKAARKAIDGYKTDHQSAMDKITKKYNESKSEKDNMVVKFAQGETKIKQLQSSVDKLELKVKDKEREKELLAEKLRMVKSETAKQGSTLDEKATELVTLRKELETQKEAVTSHEYRTKWAQNKLKSELEAHKETKMKLEEMTRKFSESREECLTIRKNCQDMIKTYQESEEIRSNSLDIELKKKQTELDQMTKDVSSLTQSLEGGNAALTKLTTDVESLRKQCSEYEVKIEELKGDNSHKVKELEDLNVCVQSLREENFQIRERLKEMQSLQSDLSRKQAECRELQERISSLEEEYRDYQMELDTCHKRDGDMLELTQKMTERNAELQSENSSLKSKISGMGITLQQNESLVAQLQDTLSKQESQAKEVQISIQSECDKLKSLIKDRDQHVTTLESELDSAHTDIKTLKKKQTSSVKELTREVHTLRRQLEVYESKHSDESQSSARQSSPGKGGSAPVSQQHSRTNSISSLDKPEGWVVINQPRQSSPVDHSRSNSSAKRQDVMEVPPVTQVDALEPSFLEPDKQKLIEKIVKLQRSHARKNEKLDFCEDHIRQLVEEVQKKSRIIQMYVMREEAGALSSDDMDRQKNSMARKGGIMASINSMHSQDGRMNLDLSLQINHKLQAVLEDTLLKNITLKDNMETLGQEIARISTENSKLQKQLQSLTTVNNGT